MFRKRIFCYGHEASGHHARMNGHLPTANQSGIAKRISSLLVKFYIAGVWANTAQKEEKWNRKRFYLLLNP